MPENQTRSIAPGDAALPPLTAFRTDIIFNALSRVAGRTPVFNALVYFLVSYLGIYAAGIATGQINGGNGLRPMYTYLLDNLCMGLLAPLGAAFIANLYNKIESAAETLWKKGIIRPGDLESYSKLLSDFDRIYNRPFVTWFSMLSSAVISAFIFFFRKSSWLGQAGGLTGVFEAFFIFVNFAMIVTVVYKCVVTVWMLQRVLEYDINIQPAHPDHAGGLRVIGSLAMAVNYFLVLVMLFFTLLMIFDPFSQRFFLVYLIFYGCAFFSFFASLNKAHVKMVKVKADALEKLENTSNHYYGKLERSSANGIFDLDSADEIVLVDNLYNIVEKMPVWPIDMSHVVKFFSAFVTPFIIFVISQLLSSDSIIYHFDTVKNALGK